MNKAILNDIFAEHKPLLIITALVCLWGLGFYIYFDLAGTDTFYLFRYNKLVYSCLFVPLIYASIAFLSLFLKQQNARNSFQAFFEVLSFNNLIRLTICCFCFFVLIFVFEGVKSYIPELIPYKFDPLFSSWDKRIHFNKYPHQYFEFIIYSDVFSMIVDRLYYFWYYVFLGYTVFVFIQSKDKMGRMSYIVTLFAIWIVLGNMAALLLSSAGPIFWNEFYLPLSNPYDYIQKAKDYAGEDVFLYRDRIYRYLIKLYYNKDMAGVGSISAMPSMHVAMCALISFHCWKYCKLLWPFAVTYLLIIMVCSVVLGWHYAIDGYVALIVTYLIWKVSDFYFARPHKGLERSEQLKIANIASKFPKELTSYDLLKSLAMVTMILDHLGAFFFPEEMWMRIMGRMSFPIWLFLVGYAKSRDLPMMLWLCALYVSVAGVFFGGSVFALNILFSIIFVRLVLDYTVEMMFRSGVMLFVVPILLFAFITPSAFVFEYGLMGLMVAMMGWMFRYQHQEPMVKKVLPFFATVTIFTYGMRSFSGFQLTLSEMPLLLICLFMTYSLLFLFTPKTYPDLTQKSPALVVWGLQFMGRYSLYIYTVHFILFMALAFYY